MNGHGKVRVAVVGSGLGGMAAAILLDEAGYDVTVYEQAKAFSRLGAGIHLSPNVTRVLRRVGILDRLLEIGIRPDRWLSRAWDSGEVLLDVTLGDRIERMHGAPYLTVHRGDFHAALIGAAPEGMVRFDKRLVGLEQAGETMVLAFADGTRAEADIVVGADGVNSMVREILLGPERPTYTGHVGHRAIFPVANLGDLKPADVTKWWAPDRHLVVYFITQPRDVIYFVSGVPEPDWPDDVSVLPCSKEELVGHFEGFHPEVMTLLRSCEQVTKWAFFDRTPLPLWTEGRIVLLGDACHPMKPHMGQGAAMAIEDAAMLARCLEGMAPEDFALGFRRYAANRMERTARVQRESRNNTWLQSEDTSDWVFSYDVFEAPLQEPLQKSA